MVQTQFTIHTSTIFGKSTGKMGEHVFHISFHLIYFIYIYLFIYLFFKLMVQV